MLEKIVLVVLIFILVTLVYPFAKGLYDGFTDSRNGRPYDPKEEEGNDEENW
jgi:hypothetical protein